MTASSDVLASAPVTDWPERHRPDAACRRCCCIGRARPDALGLGATRASAAATSLRCPPFRRCPGGLTGRRCPGALPGRDPGRRLARPRGRPRAGGAERRTGDGRRRRGVDAPRRCARHLRRGRPSWSGPDMTAGIAGRVLEARWRAGASPGATATSSSTSGCGVRDAVAAEALRGSLDCCHVPRHPDSAQRP